MTAITVDRFDLLILEELQRDGQATNSALGERIHLSTSQVGRRIQRMHEAGVIDHYCALIDPAVVGLDVMAFTEVTLDRHNASASERFEREVAYLPKILECYTLAGQADYLLRIVASDLHALSQFMTQNLMRIPGVANVKSTITLRRIKQTHVLPLDHLMMPEESKKRVKFSA